MTLREEGLLVLFGLFVGLLLQILHDIYRASTIHAFLSSMTTPTYSMLVEAIVVGLAAYWTLKAIKNERRKA